MLSRKQAPRDASFTWQHLPRGPGDRHPTDAPFTWQHLPCCPGQQTRLTTQQPLQRFPLYWQHVNTCPRGPEYQTTEQSLLRFPIHLETPVHEVQETKPKSRLSRDVCILTRYLLPAHASDFKQNKKIHHVKTKDNNNETWVESCLDRFLRKQQQRPSNRTAPTPTPTPPPHPTPPHLPSHTSPSHPHATQPDTTPQHSTQPRHCFRSKIRNPETKPASHAKPRLATGAPVSETAARL